MPAVPGRRPVLDRRHEDAAAHHDAQRFEQDLVARPLGHEAHGAEIDGAHHVGLPIGRRDDDDRRRRVRFPQLAQQREAVAAVVLGAAEAQVEQDEIDGRVRSERRARGIGVRHAADLHLAPHAFDDARERRQDQRVVVDEENVHGSGPQV
jgi:hypothetical protein